MSYRGWKSRINKLRNKQPKGSILPEDEFANVYIDKITPDSYELLKGRIAEVKKRLDGKTDRDSIQRLNNVYSFEIHIMPIIEQILKEEIRKN